MFYLNNINLLCFFFYMDLGIAPSDKLRMQHNLFKKPFIQFNYAFIFISQIHDKKKNKGERIHLLAPITRIFLRSIFVRPQNTTPLSLLSALVGKGSVCLKNGEPILISSPLLTPAHIYKGFVCKLIETS